jgi:hypothetical protein
MSQRSFASILDLLLESEWLDGEVLAKVSEVTGKPSPRTDLIDVRDLVSFGCVKLIGRRYADCPVKDRLCALVIVCIINPRIIRRVSAGLCISKDDLFAPVPDANYAQPRSPPVAQSTFWSLVRRTKLDTIRELCQSLAITREDVIPLCDYFFESSSPYSMSDKGRENFYWLAEPTGGARASARRPLAAVSGKAFTKHFFVGRAARAKNAL